MVRHPFFYLQLITQPEYHAQSGFRLLLQAGIASQWHLTIQFTMFLYESCRLKNDLSELPTRKRIDNQPSIISL